MTQESAEPGGSTGTLADVLPAAAAMLGVEEYAARLDILGEGRCRGVTVLLIDGLGWWPWQGSLDLTPNLAALKAFRWRTSVPSTTPTALATLGTGSLPGAHGIVGAAFMLPEEDRILHPLQWGSEPHPIAVQPERTVFEKVESAGHRVSRVGPSAYATSGLTRAALRGGAYIGVDTPDEMVDAVADHASGLSYAYVADLDRAGHVYGVDSPEWRTCLTEVDRLVGRMLERLGPDHRLLVTADHGMVDCSVGARVPIESLPRFADVRSVAGEPRLRHVYVREGVAASVGDAWRDALGDQADVLTRDELVRSGLMGVVDPALADRIGDIVVVARGSTVIASDVDTLVSGLRGQHGSLTDAEMDIPLLCAAGHGRG